MKTPYIFGGINSSHLQQEITRNPYDRYINPYYWVDDHLQMEIMGVL